MSWGKEMIAALDAKPAHNWQPTIKGSSHLSPENEAVWTKIDDADGVRNVAQLTRRGNLWYTHPTDGMYVYYTPTHWHR